MATIAGRLVHLIETNAARLSRDLLESVLNSDRATDMRRIDSVELMQRAKEIYGDLGQWLLNKTEADIERRYGQLGERYAKLGISESHWVWSIVLGRQQLWRFLESEAFPEGAFEVFSELELVQTLDHFFDRLVYHGIAGFEAARSRS